VRVVKLFISRKMRMMMEVKMEGKTKTIVKEMVG